MALYIHQVSNDLNRGSRRFMRINPAGNHVQVGINAVKHGNPFAIDVFVPHADPAEMIANQLGHGAACIFGQLLQRLKFRVRKPDPQHVIALFHSTSVVAYCTLNKATRCCYISLRSMSHIGPCNGRLRLPLTPPLQRSLCSLAQGNGVCQVDGLTA